MRWALLGWLLVACSNPPTLGDSIPCVPVDDDGDGWPDHREIDPCDQVDCSCGDPAEALDCDDHDDTRFPTAVDLCGNGIDEDCSGVADDDGDADGTCDAEDCADEDPSVHPGALEVCNGADDDCDGAVDDVDADGDGWRAPGCAAVPDCDDADARRNPGREETCDGHDDDCDGALLPGEVDGDGDGMWGCAGDCDDADPLVFDGAPERCNGLDDDCDGAPLFVEVDDHDGDGFVACAECDDGAATVHPLALEVCNGQDDDCDGVIDEGPDADGDGWALCEDCLDLNPLVHPGAAERCNGLDDDCDGEPGELEHDGDGDGWLACVDCQDGRADVHLGAVEICDGIDQDCDGMVDDGWDVDGDGVSVCGGDCDDGDPARAPGLPELCDGRDGDCDPATDPPGGPEVDGDGDAWLDCEDCDDAAPFVHPLAPEGCNGLDDDCDLVIDEGFDLDADGWSRCLGDCRDTDPGVHPEAVEACNGQDDDCDGVFDVSEVDVDRDGASCDDCAPFDAAIHPGAIEACNGRDDDCDGRLGVDEVDGDADGALACVDCDDASARLNLLDLDQDGQTSCPLPGEARGDCDDLDPTVDTRDVDGDGASTCDGDCDDDAGLLFPGNPEICDLDDDDCDGLIDEGFLDLDGDGSPECREVCNGVDDDSDGAVDEGFEGSGLVGVWVSAWTPPGGDGTFVAPFSTIQAAVDARAPGDPCPIRVLDGTYFEGVHVDGGLVELVAAPGAQPVIDGGSTWGHPLVLAEATAAGSRVEGFVLRHGVAAGENGGAVDIEGGALDLRDNVIEDNRSLGDGGAVFCTSCTTTIERNVFDRNRAESDPPCLVPPGGTPTCFAYYLGGAIGSNTGDATLIIADNTFRENAVVGQYAYGGAIGLWGGPHATVVRNVFVGNRASGNGGAIGVRDGSSLLAYNNLFRCNGSDLGGIATIELGNARATQVVNNTFLENDDGRGQIRTEWPVVAPFIANNLFAFSTGPGVVHDGGQGPGLNHNLFWGPGAAVAGLADPIGSNGNLWADPLLIGFVPAACDGPVPAPGLGSPAIDAGNPLPMYEDGPGDRNDIGATGGPLGM